MIANRRYCPTIPLDARTTRMIIWEWRDDAVALLITTFLSMRTRRKKRMRRYMMMIGHHRADDYDRR